MSSSPHPSETTPFKKLLSLRLQDLRDCAGHEVERLEQRVSELAEENRRLQVLLEAQRRGPDSGDDGGAGSALAAGPLEDADTEMENLLHTLELASHDGEALARPPEEQAHQAAIVPECCTIQEEDPPAKPAPLGSRLSVTSRCSSGHRQGAVLKSSGSALMGRSSVTSTLSAALGRKRGSAGMIIRRPSQCSINSRNVDCCLPDTQLQIKNNVNNCAADIETAGDEAGTLSWRFSEEASQDPVSTLLAARSGSQISRPLNKHSREGWPAEGGRQSSESSRGGIISYLGSQIGLWGSSDPPRA